MTESFVLRFLFDQHVSLPALLHLRAKGVDVVHVSEVGLDAADDDAVFSWARTERRIVVTRDYRDFAVLVAVYSKKNEPFPGVLFLSASVSQSDTGAHVRALDDWIQKAHASGRNPAESSIDWLG